MDSPPKSDQNRSVAVFDSFRTLLRDTRRTNELWLSWSVFLIALSAAVISVIFVDQILLHVLFSAISVVASYQIFRTARFRLNTKAAEVETLSELHLATA
jgi:uncharacterized membrane protein